MSPFEFTGIKLHTPVQTRDGRKVRLLAVDRLSHKRQIIGFVMTKDGRTEGITSWCMRGISVHGEGIDLVPAASATPETPLDWFTRTIDVALATPSAPNAPQWSPADITAPLPWSTDLDLNKIAPHHAKENPMDLTKIPLNEFGHVQTRDGKRIKVLATSLRNKAGRSVIGIAEDALSDDETIFYWFSDGRFSPNPVINDSNFDLVPVPVTIHLKGWMNIYGPVERPVIGSVGTRESADRRGHGRIACVPIDMHITKGQGL